MDIIDTLTGGAQEPENSFSRRAYENYVYYDNLFNAEPSQLTEEQLIERAMAMVKIALDEERGLTVTLVSGMIKALMKMLGINIEEYIEGIAEPNAEVGVDKHIEISIKINVESSEYDNGDLIYLNMLLENTNGNKEEAWKKWQEDLNPAGVIRLNEYRKAEAWRDLYANSWGEELIEMDEVFEWVNKRYPYYTHTKKLAASWDKLINQRQTANAIFMEALLSDDEITSRMLAWDALKDVATEAQKAIMEDVFEALGEEARLSEAWDILYSKPR